MARTRLDEKRFREVDLAFAEAKRALDRNDLQVAARLCDAAWAKIPEPKFGWDWSYVFVGLMCRYKRPTNIGHDELFRLLNDYLASGYHTEDLWGPYYLLGTLHFERGEFEEAFKLIDKANYLSLGDCFNEEDPRYERFYKDFKESHKSPVAMERSLRMFGISSRGLVNAEDFEALANVFLDSPSALVPTKMGLYEPMRQNFDPGEIRSLAERSDEPFEISWKSSKCDVNATKYISDYMYGTLIIDADPDAASEEEFEQFIERIAKVFNPTLMMIHLLNPMDREIDSKSRMRIEASDRPTFSTHWSDLGEGLPNFYWGMVFGKPYVELLGTEKLLKTPAHRVVHLTAETIFVQLTLNLMDCETRHDDVVDARKKAIRHLGESHFMVSTVEAMGLATAKKTSLFGKRQFLARTVPKLSP